MPTVWPVICARARLLKSECPTSYGTFCAVSSRSVGPIELISGVKEGDLVVEGPYRVLSSSLADGKKVKVETQDKPGDDKGKAKTP